MQEPPTLLRIPFSHFCRKAEWALTQAGVPYRTVDLRLWQMRHLGGATVPQLRAGDLVVRDSHDILVWADEHRRPDADQLYPPRMAEAVAAWETWAGEAIAPATRREAYRHLWQDPSLGRGYGVPWYMAVGPSRRLHEAVLRHYKARRFEATDPSELRAAMAKVAHRLAETGTGYLFGDRPTAADVSTAALLEPLAVFATRAGYTQDAAYPACAAFVDRVRPARTSRLGGRAARRRPLAEWALEPAPGPA